MPSIEAALFEILADLVGESGMGRPGDSASSGRTTPLTREPYLAGIGLKDDDVRQRSIRELRRRIDAIRRILRK